MAGSFNKVIIMGNLVRDPELRYTPQGKAVTDITVAVNDSKEKNKAVFVEVTAWDKGAENICAYLKKGRPILIEGRIATETWDDKETGKKRSKMKVVAINFQFVDSNGSKEDNGSNHHQRSSAPEQNPDDRFSQTEDAGDIPF